MNDRVTKDIWDTWVRNTSWDLPPTPQQLRFIARLAQSVGISAPIEESIYDRREAARIIGDLKKQQRFKY